MTEKFDMVRVSIMHHTFVMPREAAMAMFEAMHGCDMFVLESRWKNDGNTYYLRPMSAEQLPTIGIMSPVVYHSAKIAYADLLVEEARKK